MSVRSVSLGRTGLQVSSLCLGTLNFGWRTEEGEAVRLIHQALDAGINFVDSASCFSRERSEEIVGRALAGRRERVVLAAKCYAHDRPEPNARGNGRRHLIATVEAQLMRLQTDHIDLYYIHPDRETPMEEALATLTDLVRAGKIRYIGLSHYRAWEVVEALAIAQRLRLAPVVAEQPFYHLLDRRTEWEMLPMARHFGLGVLPHSPLANGILTGRYRMGRPAPAGSRGEANRWPLEHPAFQSVLEAVERLLPLAEEVGLSLTRLALAWLRAQPGVTAPVIGPRTEAQLSELLDGLEDRLPDAIIRRVDEIVGPGQRA